MNHSVQGSGWFSRQTRAGRRVRRSLAAACAALVFCVSAVAAARTDPAVWRRTYARAKLLLAEGRASDAALVFEKLAADPPTADEGLLAREFLGVAREAARKDEPASAHLRTTDELSVLYTSAFIYGIGTSGWFVLLTQPGNFATAVLPFIGFTGSAVGGVALADNYRPLRRGVPHSIAAGLYLGFGEGVWVLSLQRAGAARREDGSRWGPTAMATALWAGATAGGVAGGVVGAWREPTPGRVSLTVSMGTWAGLISGFAGAALESRERSRVETGFVAGGIGYNLGIVTGIAVAPLVAPTVARVRFVDLGAVGGGLIGGGIYTIAADRKATVRGGLGFGALGAAAGLGLAWWLTDEMPKDLQPSAASSPQAMLVPTQGGFLAGMSGVW